MITMSGVALVSAVRALPAVAVVMAGMVMRGVLVHGNSIGVLGVCGGVFRCRVVRVVVMGNGHGLTVYPVGVHVESG